MMNKTTTNCESLKAFLSVASRKKQRIDIGIGVGIAVVFVVLLLLLILWRYCAHLHPSSIIGVPLSTSTFIFLFVVIIVLPVLLIGRHLQDRSLHGRDGLKLAEFQRLCDSKTNGEYANFTRVCSKECKVLKSKRPGIIVSNLSSFAVGLFFLFTAAAFFTVLFRRVGERRPALRFSDMNGAADEVTRPNRPAGAPTDFNLRIVGPDEPQPDVEQDKVCAICIADLSERPVAQLPCSHRFHHACAQDWLRKAPRPLCPLCKAQVEPASGEG